MAQPFGCPLQRWVGPGGRDARPGSMENSPKWCVREGLARRRSVPGHNDRRGRESVRLRSWHAKATVGWGSCAVAAGVAGMADVAREERWRKARRSTPDAKCATSAALGGVANVCCCGSDPGSTRWPLRTGKGTRRAGCGARPRSYQCTGSSRRQVQELLKLIRVGGHGASNSARYLYSCRGRRGRAPGVQHLFNTPRRQLLVGQHTAATAARLNV